MSTFYNNATALEQRPSFFAPSDIARMDKIRFPFVRNLIKKQRGFFWQPEEFDLTRDSKDFKSLTEFEQHIFTSNLKRQILLDSIQGRAPAQLFGPHCSLPELEVWMRLWSMFEDIHSDSYQHIIENVYPSAGFVYDNMLDIKEIADCANSISQYYDDLANAPSKKTLWMAFNAANALEGIRFFVSFACSWAFAENKKMIGNANIIKSIARDENLHLAFTQHMLKALPKQDSEFGDIEVECRNDVAAMFIQVVEQEKLWAKFLFKDGSILGLNESTLCSYIDWIAKKRMNVLGIPCPYKPQTTNPLPWTQSWIMGADVQTAPQETEITSYTIGKVKRDVDKNTFSGTDL